MSKEDLALEFTKIIAPTINANCSASEPVAVNCCVVAEYYHYFLEMISRDEKSYLNK